MQLTLLSVVVLTGLGFYDDYAKISQQSSGGARSWVKLCVQAALALFIGLYLWHLPSTRNLITEIMVPFYKYPVADETPGLVGLGADAADHRGQFECGESDGRAGRAGDRLHADRLVCVSWS